MSHDLSPPQIGRDLGLLQLWPPQLVKLFPLHLTNTPKLIIKTWPPQLVMLPLSLSNTLKLIIKMWPLQLVKLPFGLHNTLKLIKKDVATTAREASFWSM